MFLSIYRSKSAGRFIRSISASSTGAARHNPLDPAQQIDASRSRLRRSACSNGSPSALPRWRFAEPGPARSARSARFASGSIRAPIDPGLVGLDGRAEPASGPSWGGGGFLAEIVEVLFSRRRRGDSRPKTHVGMHPAGSCGYDEAPVSALGLLDSLEQVSASSDAQPLELCRRLFRRLPEHVHAR